jgi:hypothetical protein
MRDVTDGWVLEAAEHGATFGDAIRRWAAVQKINTAAAAGAAATRRQRLWFRAFHQSVKALWIPKNAAAVTRDPLFALLVAEVLAFDAADISPDFLAALSVAVPAVLPPPTLTPVSRNNAVANYRAAASDIRSGGDTDGEPDAPAAKRRCVGLADVATAQWLSAVPYAAYHKRLCVTQHLWQRPRPTDVPAAVQPTPAEFIAAVAAAAVEKKREGFGDRTLAGGGADAKLVYATAGVLRDDDIMQSFHATVWKILCSRVRPSFRPIPSNLFYYYFLFHAGVPGPERWQRCVVVGPAAATARVGRGGQ